MTSQDVPEKRTNRASQKDPRTNSGSKATSWPIQAADLLPAPNKAADGWPGEPKRNWFCWPMRLSRDSTASNKTFAYQRQRQSREQLTVLRKQPAKKAGRHREDGRAEAHSRSLSTPTRNSARPPTDKPASELTAAIRGMELRNYLRSLSDSAAHCYAFWTAVRTGDAEMVLCL